MSDDTKIIDLPSGHTWALKTRVTWGMVRRMQGTDNLSEQIALFTEEWSFDAPVSAEAIDEMDIEDVIAVFAAFNEDVLPLFDGLMKRLSESSPNGSSAMMSPPSGETPASGGPTSETLPGTTS